MKTFYKLSIFLLASLCFTLEAQQSVPYQNNFDNIIDTVGWSHYSLSGQDDWEHGKPNGSSLTKYYSPEFAWVTNLVGDASSNSIMCLETPSFDLSSATEYVLSFVHQYRTYSGQGGNIEYSIDNGVTWLLLDDTDSEKKNWYNSTISTLSQAGWSGNQYSLTFKYSSHSLNFLSGNSDVKFRFKYGATSANEGWMIDQFSISINKMNIVGIKGKPVNVSSQFSEFEVGVPFYYEGLSTASITSITDYYFSYDTILTASDSLLYTRTSGTNTSQTNMRQTLDLPENLSSGTYYIILKHDAPDILDESNEDDNQIFVPLIVDSTFLPEIYEDFESGKDWWNTYAYFTQTIGSSTNELWKKGNNELYKIYGTHSGNNAWYLSEFPNSGRVSQVFESPYLDFSTDTANVVCFWYKVYKEYDEIENIYLDVSRSEGEPYYSGNDAETYEVRQPRFNNWDCHCQSLSFLNWHNNGKTRIRANINKHYTNYADLIVIDDIFIGTRKPDLVIEHNHLRTLRKRMLWDTLYYTLFNAGLMAVDASETEFYWSIDSIFDAGDNLIGSVTEPSIPDTSFIRKKFVFEVPDLPLGRYYIIGKTDVSDGISEIWEDNNTTVFPIELSDVFDTPYSNDFENNIEGWHHEKVIGKDDWEWGIPSGDTIYQAFSGEKGFITNPSGQVSSQSIMHLYTPIFDISELSNPVLEFDMFLENYVSSCSGISCSPQINISYSFDNGATWHELESVNNSNKSWFDGFTYLLSEPAEAIFPSTNNYQGHEVQRVTRYIVDINHLKTHSLVQFRYNFVSEQVSKGEGALIDNFMITENTIDLDITYKKNLIVSSLSTDIMLDLYVSNTGNYNSEETNASFYISTDDQLDDNDLFVGSEVIPVIRPDRRFYLNTSFDIPTSLEGYNYLIYQLDSSGINTESSELNNIGAWPLGSRISNYPYLNNFSDTILHGWKTYLLYRSGTHKKNMYSFRNILSVNERRENRQHLFTHNNYDGYNPLSVPFKYIETPVFKFQNVDSIHLSFDLMCYAESPISHNQGGNMEYSIDGGNTWNILTPDLGANYNWFEFSSIYYLNEEPGWCKPFNVAGILDSTFFDISFLKEEENVVFRLKYICNSGDSDHAMKFDNFKINTYSVDYEAKQSTDNIDIDLLSSELQFEYSIKNIGNLDGGLSNTRFYWSEDSILSSNDQMIHVVHENSIMADSVVHGIVSIDLPSPVSKETYYVLFFSDADSSVMEANEQNNIGIIEVNIISYNYITTNRNDSIQVSSESSSFNVEYSIINKGFSDGGLSNTSFYWSNDSLLSIEDIEVLDINESAIPSGDTLTANVQIVLPSPLDKPKYFLFYAADNNNIIAETNEQDNIGAFKVFIKYPTFLRENSLGSMQLFLHEDNLNINVNKNLQDRSFSIDIINLSGQVVERMIRELYKGENIIALPNNIANGLYLIKVANRAETYTIKAQLIF